MLELQKVISRLKGRTVSEVLRQYKADSSEAVRAKPGEPLSVRGRRADRDYQTAAQKARK